MPLEYQKCSKFALERGLPQTQTAGPCSQTADCLQSADSSVESADFFLYL